MLGVMALLGMRFALEIRLASSNEWVAAHHSAANVTPFLVADDTPNHKYKLEVRVRSGAETQPERVEKFAGTLESVNDFLSSKTFNFTGENGAEVSVEVAVHKPGHNETATKGLALRVYHSVPMQQLVTRVNSTATFPVRIAEVLAPFAAVGMEELSRSEAYAGFSLQKVGKYIEFRPRYIRQPFDAVFSFPEDATGLRSPPIVLSVEVPLAPIVDDAGKITLKKMLSARYALFTFAAGLTVLFLIGIVIDTLFCRRRRVRVKAVPLVVVEAPAAARPAIVVRTSPTRAELREAYQA